MLDANFARVTSQVTGMLTKYDVGVQAQFRAQELQVRELSARLDSMAKSSAELIEMVEKCDVALSVVESAVPFRPTPSSGLDRTPDPTIVHL